MHFFCSFSVEKNNVLWPNSLMVWACTSRCFVVSCCKILKMRTGFSVALSVLVRFTWPSLFGGPFSTETGAQKSFEKTFFFALGLFFLARVTLQAAPGDAEGDTAVFFQHLFRCRVFVRPTPPSWQVEKNINELFIYIIKKDVPL